jgi:type I restriction enzyme S subunit
MHDLFTRGIDLATGQLRPSYEQAPELYKQTELGWVPREWEVKSLGEISEKIQDGTHFSPIIDDGDYLYLTSKNIRFGYLDLRNIDKISKSQHDSIFKRCNVRKGDLLLTKDGANTGNAAINTIDEPFSMLSSVALIRSNENSIESYLLHYLLSVPSQNRIKDDMSGNAITRLTLEKIKSFLIPCPAVVEQIEISKRLDVVSDLMFIEERYLSSLGMKKKGLMQDLLTGRVRVNPP